MKKSKFSKSGPRLKGSPEAVYKELLKIRKRHGKLTTNIVLEEARNKKSPLHTQFEWNDGIAAEKFRRMQAANLITTIRIRLINEPDSKPVRAILGYNTDDGEHQYAPRSTVIKSFDLTSRSLDLAIIELESLQNKYNEIAELASVWKEVARVKRNNKKQKVA